MSTVVFMRPVSILIPAVNQEDYNWERISGRPPAQDRKSTRLNSSHLVISYAVFWLKKNTAPASARPPDGRDDHLRAAVPLVRGARLHPGCSHLGRASTPPRRPPPPRDLPPPASIPP